MNYAYGSSPTVNANPWLRMMQTANPWETLEYNRSPDLGFERFLRTVMPSNTNEQALRALFPSIQRQWEDTQWRQTVNGQQPIDFTKYLGQYNFDRDLNRMSPGMRRERSSLYNRPARVLQF